jgi:glycerol-3-phosphate dehydrogenase (NAD(P)+)
VSLRRVIRLFESYEPFVRFMKLLAAPNPGETDTEAVRLRAVVLAEKLEPRGDRKELQDALKSFDVRLDHESYRKISAMMLFMAKTLFNDVSGPVPHDIRRRALQYDGPKFFFVSHTSYYDYALTAYFLHRLGISPPIFHSSGSITQGWPSNWLDGLRTMRIPMTFSPIRHRAYSWFSAALAENLETQVIFARTSRYAVRSRHGILREPYVPHAVIASVRAHGKALVIPVSISYSIIPEDKYLASSKVFASLSALPSNWSLFLKSMLGLKRVSKVFKKLDGSLGDVAVSLGSPFELRNDKSLTLQRISHRAIEEIARNKLIHPTHIVAKAVQELDKTDIKSIRKAVENEIENTNVLFRTRYRKEPPYHSQITSDLVGAIQSGLQQLSARGILSRSLLGRSYKPVDNRLLTFYGYQADRRIYPLSGRNTIAVINAGVWGYTLALQIGGNLVDKEQLAEHSLVLYDSREDLIEKLTVDGRHPWHFRDVQMPRSIRPEADLRAAVGNTSMVLIVTPSKYFYSAVTKILEVAREGCDVVIATKGFLPETGMLPYHTVQQEMDRLGKHFKISILSGANLAHEIVNGGAGVTQIASDDVETFDRLRTLMETRTFRVVYCNDIIGASISAALKNVYAIGFGLLEASKQAPENFLATYATLVTAEIRQFGLLLGANPETFDSESQVWLADLLATCRGGRSAKFGRDLVSMDEKHGKYLPARVLMDQYRKKKIAVEGFEASRYAHRMATQRGFHPPILGEIYSILHGGKKIDLDAFIEKCLDALKNERNYPSAAIRYRPKRI